MKYAYNMAAFNLNVVSFERQVTVALSPIPQTPHHSCIAGNFDTNSPHASWGPLDARLDSTSDPFL